MARAGLGQGWESPKSPPPLARPSGTHPVRCPCGPPAPPNPVRAPSLSFLPGASWSPDPHHFSQRPYYFPNPRRFPLPLSPSPSSQRQAPPLPPGCPLPFFPKLFLSPHHVSSLCPPTRLPPSRDKSTVPILTSGLFLLVYPKSLPHPGHCPPPFTPPKSAPALPLPADTHPNPPHHSHTR